MKRKDLKECVKCNKITKVNTLMYCAKCWRNLMPSERIRISNKEQGFRFKKKVFI